MNSCWTFSSGDVTGTKPPGFACSPVLDFENTSTLSVPLEVLTALSTWTQGVSNNHFYLRLSGLFLIIDSSQEGEMKDKAYISHVSSLP